MYRFREDYDQEDTYRLSTMHNIRSHHFKFEHGGMLVYDSKAINLCGNQTESGVKQSQELRKNISTYVKKELESADEIGNI